MKSTFIPVIGLKEGPTFHTFRPAFRYLYKTIRKLANENKLPPLNTCWIEVSHPECLRYNYNFDQVKNLGHDVGWLKNGELV